MTTNIWIETSHGRISAQAAGDPTAPLVLGLHGWSQRNGAHTWAPLLAPLAAAGFRAVSVDMPGWGQSAAWPNVDLRGAAAVPVVLTILDALSAGAATLMGKSWGGGLALFCALNRPERVSKLILSAPAFSDLPALAGLTQPVLLAWAEDDPVIPIAWAAKFAAQLPAAQLLTYPGGGHSAAMRNADAFAPEAIRFLRKA